MKVNNDLNIELTLFFHKYNNDNYAQTITEINKLKNEINKLKKYHDNNSQDIQLFSNIVIDSYYDTDLDNSFIIFKSINIFYLLYSNNNKRSFVLI